MSEITAVNCGYAGVSLNNNFPLIWEMTQWKYVTTIWEGVNLYSKRVDAHQTVKVRERVKRM